MVRVSVPLPGDELNDERDETGPIMVWHGSRVIPLAEAITEAAQAEDWTGLISLAISARFAGYGDLAAQALAQHAALIRQAPAPRRRCPLATRRPRFVGRVYRTGHSL